MITCIKLTPYQDASTKSLYVQANTIIPVPGIDDYVIKVGDESPAGGDGTSLTNPTSLQLVFERNRTDEVTRFLRRVGALAVDGLPAEIKPDRSSRWAGQINQNWRYYHLWYSRLPWTNWGVSFRVNLYRDQEGLGNSWRADVGLKHSEPGIERNLANISVHDDQRFDQDTIWVDLAAQPLDDEYAAKLAGIMQKFIETLTPIVDDLENERGESED